MKYCKKCLNVDTRPNIRFTEEGLCPPCAYYENHHDIDWDERKKELAEVIAFGKENNHSGYDCIIGVSGGKDSTRQAIYVKEHLKMKPLLVSLNYPPEQLSQRGADNLSNLISKGFDCVNISCAPQTWKKLMKKGFIQYGNWCKSTELALFSSVPRLAIAYQIPLIWWGENAAVTLGDLGVKGKSESDGNRLKYGNTLAGGDVSWLLDEAIERKDIIQYCYPDDREMERSGLRIVFLGHFWKNFTLIDNGNFSALRGLEIRSDKPDEIGDYVGTSMLDEDYITVNMMIKYLKFGFGRVSDHVNEEIRYGRMSRETGVALVNRFDGKCSADIIKSFCAYLEISVSEFWAVVDRYVNKTLFERVSEGNYRRKFEVGVGL